ncbi:MAG TPA: carboxymuconolactone decarboxylase family protein [Acidimicrobiales bacterium]|nr:carboxymuconolactone decarboxylase family protein [Acidimicrobiales bacterium]
MREALAALRPSDARYATPPRQGRPKGLNILGTLAHHPALARAYHVFNGHLLFSTTLTERQRELAILRVAALRRAEYEWRQHAVLAADVGITEAELAAVAEGPGATVWPPLEAALLRAVDELVAGAALSQETWETLATSLSIEQSMDLVFTVGAYDLLAMVFGAFSIELDDDLAAVAPSPFAPCP